MYKLKNNAEVERLIAITKSNSGISGPELAKAHITLGQMLAKEMPFSKEDTTVVAVLRGGIFFAQGIYFELGCKFQLYDPKHDKFQRPATRNVIVVDSVVNTGKTISKLLDKNVFVACCVINENAVPQFDSKLYTVRVSKNSYVGSNTKKQTGAIGPDTTMRLFNEL